MRHRQQDPASRGRRRGLAAGALGIGGLALVVGTLRSLQAEPNPTIAALLLLLVILVTATAVPVGAAIAVSVAATLAFNFFLLPPFFTFTLADPQNWVALVVFLAVAAIASQLSAAVRARAQEAVDRRDALARLFDLSRDVLLMTDSKALPTLARAVARRFDLDPVTLALPRGDSWYVVHGGASSPSLDARDLAAVLAASPPSQGGAPLSASDRRALAVGGDDISLVPLRLGTKPIGVLAAGGPIEAGTLDTLAGVVAIAIERALFLDERKAAELTRQSEALKTTILASLGHDLRTPLTAIRVAASNVKAAWLGDAERIEQSELILEEVERLSRLFQNLLDMARIDAGAVATDARWTHPSELIAAARGQLEHVLRHHPVDVSIDPDVPVRIDPRLVATALAHVLENAVQYAPAGTTIHVASASGPDGLVITVGDHGPGIAPADLPHLFERFYRGTAGASRPSGTGMGLWIARALLAAAHGRIDADNCADGGGRFTISVPAPVQDHEPADSSSAR